jgi:type I restriction enzyme, S subunit
MSEWKETVIGAVCDVGDGAHSKVERQKMGVPYLTSKNFNNGSLKLDNVDFISSCDYERLFSKASKAITRPQENDILMGIIGTFGNAYKYKKEDFFGVSSSVAILRPNTSKIDPEYLKYTINSNSFKTRHNAYSGGSVQGYSNIPTIKQIPVLLPQVSTQINIVQILQSLDSKIDNLRRQNETLEEIARSIFKHWFIDFEFPNADGKPYKSFRGAMIRSDLGDIPEGWRVRTLGDVATNNSETHKFEEKNKIIFINTGDVLDGKFLHENYMSVNTLPGQAKKRIAKDDILYSEIRPKNKHFAYINFESNIKNYVVSTKFMVVRANDFILPRLLYLILKKQESIDEFNYIAESRSGTFPQITFEAVSHFQFPLPPIDIQKYLMPIFTNLMEKKEFNVIKIETLTKTRDALLPKLMSGQLRVKE